MDMDILIKIARAYQAIDMSENEIIEELVAEGATKEEVFLALAAARVADRENKKTVPELGNRKESFTIRQ